MQERLTDMARFGADNVDDFIASEMQQIQGNPDDMVTGAKPTMRPSAVSGTGTKSVTSKPNFGFSSSKKAGGSFAKPSFAMMGSKKVGGTGPPVISKASFNPAGSSQPSMGVRRRQQKDDDFIENELANI